MPSMFDKPIPLDTRGDSLDPYGCRGHEVRQVAGGPNEAITEVWCSPQTVQERLLGRLVLPTNISRDLSDEIRLFMASTMKDHEIALLKAQLESTRAELASARDSLALMIATVGS